MSKENLLDTINKSMYMFKNIGEEVKYSEKTLLLKQKTEEYTPFDTFWLTINLQEKSPKIKKSGNAFYAIKNTIDNFQDFVDLIHPDYLGQFFETAFAAYTIYDKYKEKVFARDGVFNSLIPLKYGKKPNEYWWVKQMCIAYGFDKNLNMTSHFNVYRLVTRYEGVIFSKPSVQFGTFNFDDEASEGLLKVSREKLLINLFESNKLSPTRIQVVVTFWKAYQELKEKNPDSNKFPSSEEIAIRLNSKGAEAIKKDNRIIRQAFESLFPFSKFTNIKSVIVFLHNLFGRIDH